MCCVSLWRCDLLRQFQAAQNVCRFRKGEFRRIERTVRDDVLGPNTIRSGINESRNKHG